MEAQSALAHCNLDIGTSSSGESVGLFRWHSHPQSQAQKVGNCPISPTSPSSNPPPQIEKQEVYAASTQIFFPVLPTTQAIPLLGRDEWVIEKGIEVRFSIFPIEVQFQLHEQEWNNGERGSKYIWGFPSGQQYRICLPM